MKNDLQLFPGERIVISALCAFLIAASALEGDITEAIGWATALVWALYAFKLEDRL